jgi:glycine cleavage system H lipoate-binding protein
MTGCSGSISARSGVSSAVASVNQALSERISFAELDASVQGWINHVRYADTWGLRQYVFDTLPPIRRRANP